MKNKVQVAIDGKLFPLMGTEPEEYIVSVARYIDEKITTIRESDKKNFLTSYLAVVLACVNITDELFKEKEKLKGMNILSSSGKGPEIISEMESEIEALRAENEKLKEDLRSIEDMYIEEVKDGRSDFESEKRELSEKMDVLQAAIAGRFSNSAELNDLKQDLKRLLKSVENMEESFRLIVAEEKLKAAGVDKTRRGYAFLSHKTEET